MLKFKSSNCKVLSITKLIIYYYFYNHINKYKKKTNFITPLHNKMIYCIILFNFFIYYFYKTLHAQLHLLISLNKINLFISEAISLIFVLYIIILYNINMS